MGRAAAESGVLPTAAAPDEEAAAGADHDRRAEAPVGQQSPRGCAPRHLPARPPRLGHRDCHLPRDVPRGGSPRNPGAPGKQNANGAVVSSKVEAWLRNNSNKISSKTPLPQKKKKKEKTPPPQKKKKKKKKK